MDTDLCVYLHDLQRDEWATCDPVAWLDGYRDLIGDALAIQAKTLGGTLALTGTAEVGRVTVSAPGGVIVADAQWMTMTRAEVEAVNAKAGAP